MNTRFIYSMWLDEKEWRKRAGFNNPGDRAIEDVAWILDLSLADVCKAISIEQTNPDFEENRRKAK